MRVLTVNAGSSSLKLALLDGDRLVDERHLHRWGGEAEPVRAFLAERGADAIAHRVVHGGASITGPRVVDDELVELLESLTELAPLHQPRALLGIRAAREADPAVPSVACVDTAFHADLPPAAATYALPREWNQRFGLRRFGFHGLSHAHAVRRGAELTGLEPGAGKVLSCHLGAGASMAAVADGRCVDTTMGFTPEEGLVMNTRSGSIDPGLLGWLLTDRGIDPAELFDVLATRSGMAGLSGTSGDLRDVREAAQRGTPSWPSGCTGTGWCGTPVRCWPCWAGWTWWCSPVVSANTTRTCVPWCARPWRARGCGSTPTATREPARTRTSPRTGPPRAPRSCRRARTWRWRARPGGC